MANRFAPLSDSERTAYEAVAQVLSGLNEASQHNVLKEIAFRLGREVVRPGAVRAAAVAAAARSTGAPASGRGGRGARGGRSGGRGSGTDADSQAFKDWLNAQGSALRDRRDALRAAADSPPSAEQKAAISAVSAEIRAAWQSFRTAAGGGQPS